jgi:hypothetical protein
MAPPGWQSTPAPANVSLAFTSPEGGDVLQFSGILAPGVSVEQLAAMAMDLERQKGQTVVDDGAATACAGRAAHRWTVHEVRFGIPFVTHLVMEPLAAGVALAGYSHAASVQDRPDASAFMRDFCPTDDAAGAAVTMPAVPQPGQLPTFAFVLPAGWRELPPPPGGDRMALFTDADRKMHEIIVMPIREVPPHDLEAQAAEFMTKQSPTGTVTDEGTTTVCGQPARRWTARGAGERGMVMHNILIPAGDAFVLGMYTHPLNTPPRKDALDLLTSLCPVAAPVPLLAGWARAPGGSTLSARLTSPDGSSTVSFEFHVAADDSRVVDIEHALIPRGTVTSDATQPCGTGTVRLLDVRAEGTLVELSLAYRDHGVFALTYTRPTGHPPDPGAERALTAVCRLSVPSPAP